MTTTAPAAPQLADALADTVRVALDLAAWGDGPGLEDLLGRVQTAVSRSVDEEGRLREAIRDRVLAGLKHFPDAPAAAGVYRIPDRLIAAARRNLLLPGHVTAVDGAAAGHDGLTATVVAIGVCLVRYDGAMNSWRSTFLRHDYDSRADDPVGRLRAVLDKRSSRDAAADAGPTGDPIHALLRRGFLAAAERSALVEKAGTRWKLAGGVPAPLELLTGAGRADLLDRALPLLEALLLADSRWVFLPASLANRALLTVANALAPGELAVFQTGKAMLEAIVETANYPPGYRKRVEGFAARLGAGSVVGGFRATRYAAPRLFVAPADRAVEAGIVAMADAGLNPHKGTPLMLELAGLGARTGLGLDAFPGVVEAAYVKARGSHLFGPGRVEMSEQED